MQEIDIQTKWEKLCSLRENIYFFQREIFFGFRKKNCSQIPDMGERRGMGKDRQFQIENIINLSEK